MSLLQKKKNQLFDFIEFVLILLYKITLDY